MTAAAKHNKTALRYHTRTHQRYKILNICIIYVCIYIYIYVLYYVSDIINHHLRETYMEVSQKLVFPDHGPLDVLGYLGMGCAGL